MRSAKRKAGKWGVILGGALLLGMGVDRLTIPKAADAAPYHQRVKTAALAIPLRIADWSGTDVKVPAGAVALLRPNVIMSRRYLNISDGMGVSCLLVQCGDARDMLAHYPPVCYPAQGWVLTSGVPRDWTMGDLVIRGMEYHFSMTSFDRASSLVVCNFMVMPDGRLMRDMEAVDGAAADVRQRYFGAAQLQFVFGGDRDVRARDASMSTLVGGMRPTLDAIRSGGLR